MWAAWLAAVGTSWAATRGILLEAESFDDIGGWVIDTQAIEAMGSPYLMAHGLGQPVSDAVTRVKLPVAGQYRVWVRTYDWVARWDAPGTPGRFQVWIQGRPLPTEFGTRGADWCWHDGGVVELPAGELEIRLHDLTGFNGRCDAIWLGPPEAPAPPNSGRELWNWRRVQWGQTEPVDGGEADLVVVGGGLAGTACAISAARMGCKVILIQNRPVLGGNSSSEVRVWPQGKTRLPPFPRVGEIVEEISNRPKESPGKAEEYDEAFRERIVRAEPNIALYLLHHVHEVECMGQTIRSVVALDIRASRDVRFRGRLFVDATGHGTVGRLAGAEHVVQEKGHMGLSNMWRWRNAPAPRPFPDVPWALQLTLSDFPFPKNGKGEWFWESGFDLHPILALEEIRDWNLRAVFGAFAAMKNARTNGVPMFPNAELEWVSPIGGARESVQLIGDVVLTEKDVRQRTPFPDACVPSTWDIDLHVPEERFAQRYPDRPFISRAIFGKAVDRDRGYPIPYRCFYSRNISNLFMAGRCISVDRGALGTVRVMKTGGMMGEVVGKAASVCLRHGVFPRAVYEKHWSELTELLQLPGNARRGSYKDPAPPAPPPPEPAASGVDPKSLPGIVVDDTAAEFQGTWAGADRLEGFIGTSYRYSSPSAQGKAIFSLPPNLSGEYEVRLAWRPHENRASNVSVRVIHAAGETTVTVDQRQPGPLPHGMVSLGKFRFSPGSPGSVVVESKGASGHVCVDAVQVLPVQ